MSKTTSILSEDKLFAVSLPQATETYTVISHEFIVNHVREGLQARGFSVLSSAYRANHTGEVARGVHVVQYGDDPDMKMIFSWVNSYDKSTKFQCGVGAQVTANESYILSEGMTNWIRKHTGSADTEAEKVINDQLDKAEEYFISLVDCKNKMKEVMISPVNFYEFLGRLYFTNAVSTQQLSAIKFEMNNSKAVYNAPSESLWVMYNHILVVLKSAHPKTWMKQQTHIHYSIMNEFDILAHQPVMEEVLEELEEIDPLTENYGQPENQTNLLVQIAEVTGDDSILEPSKPFTETLEEVVEEELLEEIIEEEEIVEVAPERVKFAVDLTEDDLTPVEEELEEIEEDEEVLLHAQYPVTPEDAFQTEAVTELTEDELASQLYGVDNNNEVVHDLDAEEDQEWEDLELAGAITPIVQYQDPAGNTFEAPIVTPCAGHDAETEKEEDLEFSFNPEVEVVEEEELLTEAQPMKEDHEEDFHIKNVLSNELEELFGEAKDFTYKLIDDKYLITFEDQSTVELDKEYIDLLI